jgi:tripartite-type tricarboxylate transporter receptor subunit TctC
MSESIEQARRKSAFLSKRRKLLFARVTRAVAIALAALGLAPSVIAQVASYPAKPVRVVVPFSPGSPIEVPARAITQRMIETLGQPFVFDYRTGASGTIGTEAVARAPKDGYTMLITNCSHTANPSYYKKLPFDTAADFAPVSQINGTYGNVLVVHPSVPVRSAREFIALAKARPGELKYASAGIGSPPHVSAALFAAMAGINLLHVPYKGTAVALNDVLGEHIESISVSSTIALPYMKAGRLRALAISGPRRHPLLPDVPTYHEVGLTRFEMTCYHGIWFPAGTPPEIIRRVHAEVAKVVALPEVRNYFADNSLIPVGSTPEEFADFINNDIARQAAIVKEIGLQPQ